MVWRRYIINKRTITITPSRPKRRFRKQTNLVKDLRLTRCNSKLTILTINNTTRTKVQVFTIGAFFAGIAGALYASYFFVIKPDQFGFLRSIDILVIVVLGGLGSMSGTVIAAILLALLSTALQEFSDIRMILYSLMLVLIMIFRPGGIMGSKEVADTVLGKIFTRKGAKR